ncbi:glycoside hydrolase family 16 protein [Tessaracoccus caeni]|uniref:glycoside hydrolase family 16 protein n=1 Tax=Tessaracoccus caeni TaxID=3031239 RepID=UPI0023D9CC71|nr:family 16 glycosylhydrolase [Tessaracoccus caeni]MDF1489945.1 family 16 glycosylhydrolase [Tessaracoccus caeni]
MAADKKATLEILPIEYDTGTLVLAAFSTGHEGRTVSLQYKDGDEWKEAASGEMDAAGTVSFTLDSVEENTSYRAVADTYQVSASETVEPIRTPVVEAGGQWNQLLRDDFSEDELDDRWNYTAYGQYWGSRLCSSVDPGQTIVEDGNLVQWIHQLDSKDPDEKNIIRDVTNNAEKERKARRSAAIEAASNAKELKKAKAMDTEGCPDGVFYNARVETKDAFTMSQGMIAARVKFPKDQGMHGSVWLQTTRNPSVDRPLGTEIDMIESFGYGKGVSNIIHYDDDGNGKLQQHGFYVIKEQTANPDWWDEYHVYSVEWGESGFIFRIDGVETERFDKKPVKGDEHYLAISMLASDWETKYIKKPSGKLPGLQEADLPNAKMYVDWIEAWERA